MKCPKCGQICRNNRETCALCGTPLTQKRSSGWLIALILFLVLVAASILAYQFWLKDLLPAPWEEPTAEEAVSALEAEETAVEPEAGETAAEPEAEETAAGPEAEETAAEPEAEETAAGPETEETAAEPETEGTYQVLEIPVTTPAPRADFLFDGAAQIYAEPSYSLALCGDGSVKLAGQSGSPEFGFDLFDWSNIKQLIPTETFIAGLTEKGRVRLTGEVGGYEEAAQWKDVETLYYDSGTLLGLTGDGRVYAVGPDQISDPSDLKDIVKIIPGYYDTVVEASDGRVSYLKRSGVLWDAGDGKFYMADVAAGPDFVLYLMEDGSVITSASLWTELNTYNGGENPYYGWDNMQQLLVMDYIVAGLTRDGQVLCTTHLFGEPTPDTSSWTGVTKLIPDHSRLALFGLTEDGQVLVTPEAGAEEVRSWKNVVDLQVNQYYVVGLTADGQVLCLVREGAPAALATEDWENVSAISLGAGHLLALQKDGTVLATGDNSFGQCGGQF